MYNLVMLEKTGNWARGERNGIRLNMGVWVDTEDKTPDSCITAACIGGWAVHSAGAEFLWSVLPGDTRPRARRCLWGGTVREVSDAAMEILGINEYEADVLFDLNEEEDEDRALDFLNVLIERARSCRTNMNDEEVTAWTEEWYNDKLSAALYG